MRQLKHEIEIANTSESLKEWDDFVFSNPKGSHLVLSDWLRSYRSYGFDYEVAVLRDEVTDKIFAGYGAIIAGFMGFKFYIIPYGPVFSTEEELLYLLEKAQMRAKKLKVTGFQFSLPLSDNELIRQHCYSTKVVKNLSKQYQKGNRFKMVYSSYGMNWVPFNNLAEGEELITVFSPKVRRDIRIGYKFSPQLEMAITEKDCQEAYKVIEQNAKEGGYSVRSFEDFKETLLNLIKMKRAYFLTAKLGTEIKGVLLLINSSKRLLNITGGTVKEKPDIKIGFFLQYEAMKLAQENGYEGYDISMGGSTGVESFKQRFNTQKIFFEDGTYYCIIDDFKFKIYRSSEKFLMKNKAAVSKVLRIFR